ncbi:MAG: hypothetical protein ACC608_01520 [Anaerofustis sp.]
MDWLSIVLGLIFTCVFYMLAPFIYKISAKAPIDSKKANRFALWNSVILFFVFFIATIIIMGDELNTIKGLSAGPAIIYYWINAAYLKHQPKNKQQNGNPSDAVPPPIYQSQNKEGITTPMQAQSAIPNIPLKHVIMKRSDAALPEPDLTDDNETLLQKAFDFLRAEQWQSAYDYSEAVLERDYAQAQAYICELLAELRLKEEAMLGTLERDLTDYEKFRIALRSADDEYRQTLESYMASNAALSKQRQSAAIYRTGIARKNAAKTINDFLRAAEVFEAIKDFPDAQAQATECRSLAAGFTERQKQKREAAQLHDIKNTRRFILCCGFIEHRTVCHPSGNHLQGSQRFACRGRCRAGRRNLRENRVVRRLLRAGNELRRGTENKCAVSGSDHGVRCHAAEI